MTDTNIDETSPLIFSQSQNRDLASNERTDLQRKLSVWFILISAGFERLAFYSLAGNLVLFLTSEQVRWSSVHSVTVTLIFLGTSYISALFFAWLSDGKFGRARTIILGFILYIIGYTFIVLLSTPDDYNLREKLCLRTNSSVKENLPFFFEPCIPQILSAFIVTGFGASAVQANIAIFGVEQVRDRNDTRQYFDKYYAAVNTGGLVAFAILAYVQQNICYFLGYVIPAGFLVLAFVLFLSGFKFYVFNSTGESLMSHFFPVIRNAFSTWRKYRENPLDTNDDRQNSNLFGLFRGSSHEYPSKTFLDYAKISNEGKYLDRIVDDIKSLRRIIIIFLLLIPYWLVYIQIETSFLIQGLHMRLETIYGTDHDEHKMPIIWLSLGDQLIIIVTIFLSHKFVYKRCQTNGRRFSIRTRIILGMMCAIIAMICAGTVEFFRQKECQTNHNQKIGGTNYNASHLSIFYQFPQHISIGLSEVFTAVASLEFAYSAAPPSARSFIMSLRFFSAGISAFIGVLYIGIFLSFKENFTLKNRECKAEVEPELFYIYFYALAGFQFVSMIVFILYDRKYKLLKAVKRRLTTRLFVGSASRSTTR